MALRLTRGEDSIVLAPADGGAIVGWTRAGRHILRRPSPEAVLNGQPGAMACFPLVPYCNRIANRRLVWNGQIHELAPNFGDNPHAIHGTGWQRTWTVDSAAPDRATLSLRHTPDSEAAARAWPFAFHARLTYVLSDSGLTLDIAATNTDSTPAPMGIGAHPWFPRPPGGAIAFQADGIWHLENSLPTRHGPIPAAWSHARGRAIGAEPLDHCFTEWSGEALLPGLRLTASPIFACLQVFTPANADFFCVEPVSHIPNAPTRPDLPPGQAMTVLTPGETLRGTIALSPA